MGFNRIRTKIAGLYNSRWFFSLVMIFAILIIYMFLEIKNHRFWMHDFEVYHKAASRIVCGENLYRGDIDGFYKYKYSPTCAIYFIPLGVLPFSIAKVVYWILLAGIICLGFYLALQIALPDFKTKPPGRINTIVLLAALILVVHFERELHLGQVNHLLLVIYLVIIALWQKSRKLGGAILWAGSIFIKPFGLIFLPYFIIKREFRLIGWFLLSLAVFALMPIIFFGWSGAAGQYFGWFKELSAELSQKQNLLQARNHTIFSLIARFTPARLLEFSSQTTHVFQIGIFLLIAILFLILLRKGREISDKRTLEMAFLIALIPLLSFTSHNAFGFLELAVFLILIKWPELPRWGKVLSIIGFAFSGGNIHDLAGKTLWNFFSNISLVAWGAMIILGVLVMLRVKRIA